MDVDARLLRYFVVLSEELHFGRAATRLFVSQPALSQQIRKLEERVGLNLFARTRRQVVLTPAGEALVTQAKAVLAELEAFYEKAQLISDGRTGRVTVGFIAQAANELTPLVLRRFKQRLPEVEVVMRQSPLGDMSGGLSAGTVDVAILRLPIESEGLVTHRLLTETRVLVLPSDHRLATRSSVQLDDFHDEPRVVTATNDAAFRAFALELTDDDPDGSRHIGAVVNSVDEFLEAVLAGRGVALAPESARRYYARPGVAYVDVADATPSVVALAWRRGIELPPSVTAFISTCLDVAEEQRRASTDPP